MLDQKGGGEKATQRGYDGAAVKDAVKDGDTEGVGDAECGGQPHKLSGSVYTVEVLYVPVPAKTVPLVVPSEQA